MNSSNNNLYLRLDSLSSLNNIATTNPITNQISIPGFGETNIYILLKRKYPQELLSVYLHEITHYNCFDSHLGMVVFHLGLEINKLYFQIKNDELFSKQNKELHTQLFELVIRYNFIIEFIRPFAEGIALFAQFDDYLGDSECFSKTLMHVFENFIDYEYIDSFNIKEINKQNLQQLVNTFLLCNRLSEDSIHEKFNLLTQPFSCSNKFASDYLPGYVFVKTLWAGSTIGNKCSNFLDKNLFITYLTDFFFNDFGLIGILLNQDTRDNESLNAIGNYIQNRFQHFWDVTDNSLIHEYEEHISSSANKNNNSHDSLIHEYAPVILEIVENLTADIEENKFGFHFKTNKNYFYTGLLLFTEIMIKRMNLSVEDSCILSKKNFLSLGYYEDDIEINKNGRGKFGKVEINDSQLEFAKCYFPALEGVEPGKGKGKIEFFYIPNLMCRCLCFFRDDELVGLHVTSRYKDLEVQDKIEREIIRLFEDHKRLESKYIFNNFQSNINDLYSEMQKVTGTPWTQSLEYLSRQTKHFKDSFYLPTSLLNVRDEHLNNCLSLMEESGFSKVFQDSDGLIDRDLMNKFAKFSLVNSFAIEKQANADFMKMSIDKFNDFIEQLITRGNIHNIPLVMVLDTFVVCLV